MTPNLQEIQCIHQCNATLGEGPIWDWRSGDLFWLDIRRQRICRFNLALARQTGQWVLPERVGCIGLTIDAGELVVANGMNVSLLHLETGVLQPFAAPRQAGTIYRLNDGAVDARGRFWINSMIDDYYGPEAFTGGRLFRIDPDGSVEDMGLELKLPNGIGWSPDGSRMYLNDTVGLVTYVFDFDAESGRLSGQEVLVRHDEAYGYPDGMAIDADGNIWTAKWDGWCIQQYSPSGALLRTVSTPVRRPSSVAFGGEALDVLLFTSATVDFKTSDFLKSPDAGGLFRLNPGVTGRRENLFNPSRSVA